MVPVYCNIVTTFIFSLEQYLSELFVFLRGFNANIDNI